MKKNRLPTPEDEFYPGPQTASMDEIFICRTRNIKKLLDKLDVSKATGPYPVGNTRIL